MPQPISPRRLRPRRLITALVALPLLGLLGAVPGAGSAQDPSEAAPATPAPILSTLTGEVPTTGARRPGPFDLAPAEQQRETGVAPLSIQIEDAAVDAGIETLRVVDGAMQDPTGPWVVGWYENLGSLGEGGNVVMAGHIDYWNVGPAVFYSIAALAPGALIGVTGEDGQLYDYEVEWVREFDAADAPLDDIVGPTDEDTLTLITCGGTFDYTNAQYLQRTVVRANRIQV
jgi:sortase A